MIQHPDLQALFERFSQMSVLIIGDVMIDAYLWGKVDRISPEAPVPVVSMTRRESRLGGAANVALNVMTMGARPVICSVIGDDDRRSEFMQLLEKRGFGTEGIVAAGDRLTTVKTRIISQGHHLLRVDEEITTPLSAEAENALLNRIQSILNEQSVDVIIFEDYNKGVLTPNVIKGVIEEALKRGIPTAVDPKKDNFFTYKGVSLFKPNLKELKEGLKREFDKSNRQTLLQSISDMEAELNNSISLVTLSELGVIIKQGNNHLQIPAHQREILDVSGAGDTVISVASLALAAGCALEDIAALSNLAGGQVCEKVGVVPVDKEQLLREALKLGE